MYGAPPRIRWTDTQDAFTGVRREALAAGPPTLWRWAPFLPVDAGEAVSLGEGMTPLVAARHLGHDLGVRLFIKDESRNATWSFQDRLVTVAISAARWGPMVTQMSTYGAMVLAVRDQVGRWPLLEAGEERLALIVSSQGRARPRGTDDDRHLHAIRGNLAAAPPTLSAVRARRAPGPSSATSPASWHR